MRETAVEDAVVGAAATNCARRLAAGLEARWAQLIPFRTIPNLARACR